MNHLTIPDSVQLSASQALRLTKWAIVAILVSGLSRFWLSHHPDAPVVLRTLAAVLPLLPSLLWVRSLVRWMGTLDELQRSIQYGAWLSATVGTLFVVTALSLLKSAHVLELGRIQHDLGWEGTFVLIFALYGAKCVTSIRRFQ